MEQAKGPAEEAPLAHTVDVPTKPPPSEATPLKAPVAESKGTAPKATLWYIQYAAALAIAFYVAVAITKILLTKVILNAAKAPVALSAMSCIVTCVMLLPVFALKPSTWGVIDWGKNGAGFALVTVLVVIDLAFTNMAMSELSIPIQQSITATNPAVTVIIESIVRRKLKHPVIYGTIAVLIVGPIIAQIGAAVTKSSLVGELEQVLGVLASACKYVFAHSVMGACKKDCGAFAFLFWLDAATLILLVPWGFVNGEWVVLFTQTKTALDWFFVLINSILGGMRFFSQLMVLRVTTATNLSCANICFQATVIYLALVIWPDDVKPTPWLFAGTGLTICTSAVYTYWKISKVLEKAPGCIKINDQFVGTIDSITGHGSSK